MRQTEKIEIRVSNVEKMLIKAICENQKTSMSDYIRKLIFEDMKKSGLLPIDSKRI